MTHSEAVEYLLSLLGDIRGAHFGLERINALLERLGRPERDYRIVHVAGTNGKGSTCAMIEAGLRAAGNRTGFYSSPHLSRFNERFEVDGEPVGDDVFVSSVEEVRAAIEKQVADEGPGHPTMFEAVTAVGFCVFRRKKVDWAVVEVGLGGRLDATNVVHPELAVVTPIDLDHEAWLGKSPESIAAEKAGILKRGSRAVFSRQSPEAAEVLAARAADLYIPASWATQWRTEEEYADRFGRFRFIARGPRRERLAVELNLAGEHQVDNALTAIAALVDLGIAVDAIEEGLAGVVWPGRLERLETSPPTLLDAAHNPSGARTLAAFLRRFYNDKRIILIYGSSRDKAVDDVASLLFPVVDHVILTRSAVSRSVKPETLARVVDHHHDSIEQAETVASALGLAGERAGRDDLVVVAGSIFLVGEARDLLLPGWNG